MLFHVIPSRYVVYVLSGLTPAIIGYRCCNATIENYCTTYWYDDGSGNIIPPIGGGGGSTSGWENPCRPIPGIDDDPCSGGNGGQGWGAGG
ncbi:MAG: hypothetical protein WDO16_11100 [Bacteroidota bacterium]